jgi:hypothetical protein
MAKVAAFVIEETLYINAKNAINIFGSIISKLFDLI